MSVLAWILGTSTIGNCSVWHCEADLVLLGLRNRRSLNIVVFRGQIADHLVLESCYMSLLCSVKTIFQSLRLIIYTSWQGALASSQDKHLPL